MPTFTLFSPENYPTKPTEIRAYTVAAFRLAQNSDQLSLIPMRKDLLLFLIKERALGYWLAKGRLKDGGNVITLTPDGLVVCQQALANQLTIYNATPSEVQYWTLQFTRNNSLPRQTTFSS
jgi:hypothetical protein